MGRGGAADYSGAARAVDVRVRHLSLARVCCRGAEPTYFFSCYCCSGLPRTTRCSDIACRVYRDIWAHLGVLNYLPTTALAY